MSRENRAAIYLRVSTTMQAEEGFSMEAQENALMDVIRRKDLTFFRSYSDAGKVAVASRGQAYKRSLQI